MMTEGATIFGEVQSNGLPCRVCGVVEGRHDWSRRSKPHSNHSSSPSDDHPYEPELAAALEEDILAEVRNAKNPERRWLSAYLWWKGKTAKTRDQRRAFDFLQRNLNFYPVEDMLSVNIYHPSLTLAQVEAVEHYRESLIAAMKKLEEAFPPGLPGDRPWSPEFDRTIHDRKLAHEHPKD
jgi:hypothetical protein